MNIKSLLQNTSLEPLTDFISEVNFNRCTLYLNSIPKYRDYTIGQIVQNDVIEYIPRCHPMNYRDWFYLVAVSTSDFLRKFPFVYQSSSRDQSFILQKNFVKVASFCEAFRYYLLGEKQLTFPDGSNILIEDLGIELGERIKFRLVAKCCELQITNEEFLLLLVLIFSSPAIEDLSDTGNLLLSSFQSYYSSSLLKYCMLTFYQDGPIRFTKLLDVFQVVGQHYEDLNRYFVFLQLTNPEFQLDDIVKKGFNLL